MKVEFYFKGTNFTKVTLSCYRKSLYQISGQDLMPLDYNKQREFQTTNGKNAKKLREFDCYLLKLAMVARAKVLINKARILTTQLMIQQGL